MIPDLFINAGGVTVSYFEWLKNLNHVSFGRLTFKYNRDANMELLGQYKRISTSYISNRDFLPFSASVQESIEKSFNRPPGTMPIQPNAQFERTMAVCLFRVDTCIEKYHSRALARKILSILDWLKLWNTLLWYFQLTNRNYSNHHNNYQDLIETMKKYDLGLDIRSAAYAYALEKIYTTYECAGFTL
jgi:glutamate dehydrogenase (NAD(P)+)